jgi:cell division protein YceG involved in septum cleavage
MLLQPIVPKIAGMRVLIWTSVIFITASSIILLLLLDTKIEAQSVVVNQLPDTTVTLTPFPLGVDPITENIVEDPSVETYLASYVASNHTPNRVHGGWFEQVLVRLANLDWYQNLATPATRILIIQSGERKEEVVKNISRILRWNTTESEEFLALMAANFPTIPEGTLYPGRYVVASDAKPETVAIAITERFNAEVRLRYADTIATKVPLETALVIASLIEREAYDFTDMRYISGVIWNRLFIDMKLQIDATLQYARGAHTAAAGGRFWPVPTPADKYIDSPFNTYKHAGLPPSPIANPSIEAIVAALNPRSTDCLFYYHTNDGTFYCNTTYENHKAGIAKHLRITSTSE